jgi:peptidoglycan/LPS O-acetylase OafA/YrhL
MSDEMSEPLEPPVPLEPPAGTRRRLDHIDAMRPVKQAAVISTHTLLFFAPIGASLSVTGLIMLTRFSRDAFLFVSACMLTYSYRELKKFKATQYFKRRFMSVGVPYLAWTVIYYFYTSANSLTTAPYYTFHDSGVFTNAGLHYFLHLLFTGYYHLYYLIVIMEFYVLFPLLLLLIRRLGRWHTQIAIFAFLWQIGFGLVLNLHTFGFRLSGVMQTRLITSYPIYLIGGMIVALHLDAIHEWIVTHAKTILVSTFVSAVVAEVLLYWAHHANVPDFLHTGSNVFGAAIVPYDVGAILCVYLFGVHLVSPNRSDKTRAAVQSGSDNSYGVYLSQMLWIPFLLRLRNHFNIHWPWPVAVLAALILVYFMGFLFTALLARTPLAKAVTGRSQASWSSLRPFQHDEPEAGRGDANDGGPMTLSAN